MNTGVKDAKQAVEAALKLMNRASSALIWLEKGDKAGGSSSRQTSPVAGFVDDLLGPQPAISRKEWTAAYINDLPDSAFAFVELGGKDATGKTVPRSLRHFPHHDATGELDLLHFRNALARAGQSPHGPKAMPHLKVHRAALAKAAEAAKPTRKVVAHEGRQQKDRSHPAASFVAQLEELAFW